MFISKRQQAYVGVPIKHRENKCDWKIRHQQI